MGRLWQKLGEEVKRFHPKLWMVDVALSPMPPFVGSRVRAILLRQVGFRVGPSTMFWGAPIITGPAGLYDRLIIGEGCWINGGCQFDLGGEIRVGDHVSLGPEVMILTTTHEVARGSAKRRATAEIVRPVTIGNGAWLGARCTILPGVNVGEGAIVAAGAVVTHDVPANTMVAGVPARAIRDLSADNPAPRLRASR